MPIYEYQCGKCHHHLEALQKMSDKPLRECPECGKHTLKRLLSAPMFRLAGSGWYETDFKSDKESKRNLADREEAPSEAAKEAGDKPDAKPAAKDEAKPAVTKPESTGAARKVARAKPAAKAAPRPAAKKPATTKKPATMKKTARKR